MDIKLALDMLASLKGMASQISNSQVLLKRSMLMKIVSLQRVMERDK